jgi:hypothetical protein
MKIFFYIFTLASFCKILFACELKSVKLSAKPEVLGSIEIGTETSFRKSDHSPKEVNLDGVVWKKFSVAIPGIVEVKLNQEPVFSASTIILASLKEPSKDEGKKSAGKILGDFLLSQHVNKKNNSENIRLNLNSGNYAIGYKSYESASYAGITLNFFPVDAELNSGLNKSSAGATPLVNSLVETPKASVKKFSENFLTKKYSIRGTASYQNGNRSDWYSLDGIGMGVLSFKSLRESKGLVAQMFFPDGTSRFLKESEFLHEPSGVKVLVSAAEMLSQGDYQLSFESQSLEDAALTAFVLRTIQKKVLLSVGLASGIKLGMTAELFDSNQRKVSLVFDKVLKRSSEGTIVSTNEHLLEQLAGKEVKLVLK